LEKGLGWIFRLIINKDLTSGWGKLGSVTTAMNLEMIGLAGAKVLNVDLGKLKAAWQATLDF